MLINIKNKVIILQSKQWGNIQPDNYTVTFEQLLHANAGDSFESEPYSMARESHHEILVVDQPVYGGRVMATVHTDGYTAEENSEYFEYSYPLYLQLPEDCSSPVIEDEQETYNVELPGDDEISSSSEDGSSDEELFGVETLRKLGIDREQRG